MDILNIIFLIIGIGAGGFIGWLIKTIQTKLKMAELENQNYKLQEQLTQATSKLKQTETLLQDTLAAVELLKAYKAIDDATKIKIDELKLSFKDGKATPETYKKYQAMIDEINKRNQSYNKDK